MLQRIYRVDPRDLLTDDGEWVDLTPAQVDAWMRQNTSVRRIRRLGSIRKWTLEQAQAKRRKARV